MQEKSSPVKRLSSGSPASAKINRSQTIKMLPFSNLKQFVKRMQDYPSQQRKIAAQNTHLYKDHPDYVLTEKEISELLPNMKVEPNNKILTVFGINHIESADDKKLYNLSPLVFIYAVLTNTCNDLDFNTKIRFAFNMYDDDRDGLLSREDVFKLLSSQNEENGIGLQDPVINEMVDTIFEELDKDSNGTIDKDEFTQFFSQFKTKNIVISANNKRTAAMESTPRSSDQKKKNIRRCFYLKQQLLIEGSKYFWILLYLAGLAVTGWHYYTAYGGGKPSLGAAKMFAGMINYNVALIVLIINKSFITFLRGIPFIKWIFPIDKNVVFHKYMGIVMFLCGVGHTFAHLFGTYFIFMDMSVETINANWNSRLSNPVTYPKLLFETVPGMTGLILLLGFLLMLLLSRKIVRNKCYELFWYSHHLYIVWLIMMHFHGNGKTYWKWVYGPVLLLVAEKIFKFYNMIVYRYQIANLRVSSGVIELELRRPRSFMYTAGQYAMVNIPEISKLQWHPFTVSSCPKDTTINFHISPAGWWTKKLAQLAKDYETKKIKALPTVRIDGPWGAPSQHYEDYKHLMIISSGIGATPFCSILKEILGRLRKNDQRLKFKEIDFFWVNRKPQNTKWLNKVLLDLRKESQGEWGTHLNLYMFYTGAYEKYDFRSFMLWNGFQFMKEKGRLSSEKMANYDCMHWGRPDWDDVFARVSRKYEGKKVGVFACANKMLCHEIYSHCVKYSDVASFHFSKENF